MFDPWSNQSRLRDLICYLTVIGEFREHTGVVDRGGLTVARTERFIVSFLGVDYFCKARFMSSSFEIIVGANDWHVELCFKMEKSRIIENYRGECIEEQYHIDSYPGMEGIAEFLRLNSFKTHYDKVVLWFAIYGHTTGMTACGEEKTIGRDLMMLEMMDEYREKVDEIVEGVQ